MKDSNIHLPGLNGLRFFSALAVILSHIELLKMAFGFHHQWNHPIFFYLGGIGVYFFFVLSGFLITYLLLKEKEQTANIDIKKFYIRRILRIWPLYYLITIIGFFILPDFSEIKISYLEHSFHLNYYPMLIFYLLILPNIATAIYGHVPHIGHLWTIGVEEQFYIIWPIFIKKFTDNLIPSITKLIFAIIFIKAIILFSFPFLLKDFHAILYIKEFFAGFKIESMAIGSIGAYLLWSNHKILHLLFNPFIHALAWLLIPLLIFFTPSFIQDANHLIYSTAFITIILNISSNKKSFIKLENPILNFFGKISYGIYMYHFMIIPIIIYFLKKNQININSLIGNIYLYSLSILLTLLIASISYYFFEKPFLNIKNKFSIIHSKV